MRFAAPKVVVARASIYPEMSVKVMGEAGRPASPAAAFTKY